MTKNRACQGSRRQGGNKRLESEGRAERAKGSVKDAVDNVADSLTASNSKHGR